MRIQLKALSLITEWISFLWMALPAKLRPTFLELLTGAMVSQSGHVTKALLSIRPIRTWTTYFKAIEKGQFFWMKLAKQWLALLMSQLGNKELIVAIDDFITPRSSLKAPSVALHHDHAKRMNRPRYLWGQIRVSLAMVGNCGNRHTAFPLLMHLIRKGGNRTKLHSALLLMRVLMKWVPTKTRVKLLLDCWYMKAPFLLPIIDQVECIIGQVRKDSALYSLPTRQVEKKPGRPRKYGRRLYFETIQCEYLQQETKLQAYGKKRLFQFYSFKAKVRFLKGHLLSIPAGFRQMDKMASIDLHHASGSCHRNNSALCSKMVDRTNVQRTQKSLRSPTGVATNPASIGQMDYVPLISIQPAKTPCVNPRSGRRVKRFSYSLEEGQANDSWMDGYGRETTFSRFINWTSLGPEITKNADARSEHDTNFRVNRLKKRLILDQYEPSPAVQMRGHGKLCPNYSKFQRA